LQKVHMIFEHVQLIGTELTTYGHTGA